MDTTNDNTVRIYTGSPMMVQALVSRLKERNINPIVRDDQQNAIMFGSGSNYADQLRIFVREDELAVAKPIADAFKREMAAKD